MVSYNWSTCSKVIKAQVNTLELELARLLEQNLRGIYLHGSLALGGFQPTRSDINVIVVTEQRIALEKQYEIITFLLRVSKMPCPFDIYFLVTPELFPFQPILPYHLHYSETLREHYQEAVRSDAWKHWNESSQHEPDLTIYLAVLQQQGICLQGVPVVESFPPVPTQAFHDALVKNLQGALSHPRHDPISFVLNACRSLAYFREQTILSKDAGGEWALAHFPEQFHLLIQQALTLYRCELPKRPVGRTTLDDFAAYISNQLAGA